MTDHTSQSFVSRSALASQLAGWLVALSFLLLTITAVILSWGTIAALNWADDQVAEKRLEMVRDLMQAAPPDSAMIAHEVSEDNQGPRQIFIRVLTDNAEYALATPNFPEAMRPELFPDVGRDSLDSIKHASVAVADHNFRTAAARVAFAPATSKDAVIQVAIDTSQDDPAIRWYRNLLLAVLLGALLLSALATWIVVRRKLAPLAVMAKATSKIRSTTLSERLATDGLPDELRELALSFNSMLERLETAYQGLRQYSDDIAHELRSPLSRMLLNGEVTLARDRPPEDIKAALAFNIDECRQLADLVETLLFIARAENKQMALNRESIDVAKELGDIIAYFAPLASEKTINLHLTPSVGVAAEVDRLLFRRAVSNVIANAIAHTPENGRITIGAETIGGELLIRVEDTGKGIDPKDLPHVLDRFYRSDKARSFGGGRVGLGLAIVKGIVEVHGGEIKIMSSPGKGADVLLVFANA